MVVAVPCFLILLTPLLCSSLLACMRLYSESLHHTTDLCSRRKFRKWRTRDGKQKQVAFSWVTSLIVHFHCKPDTCSAGLNLTTSAQDLRSLFSVDDSSVKAPLNSL
mmetsp:Transcript_51151/g.159802  ORF Transcript_51151/g.159802 Transcript_51151/m.159802 type:complete len:107 (-) Transcript_51151:193-513(-)